MVLGTTEPTEVRPLLISRFNDQASGTRAKKGVAHSRLVGLKTKTEGPGSLATDLPWVVFLALVFCVQRQAAAVRMFLSFFGLGVLAFNLILLSFLPGQSRFSSERAVSILRNFEK